MVELDMNWGDNICKLILEEFSRKVTTSDIKYHIHIKLTNVT
jgi:hypothetical protein